MKTKMCTKCKQILPVESFNTRTYHSGNMGYKAHCRVCQSLIARGYTRKDTEKIYLKGVQYRASHKAKRKMWYEANRAHLRTYKNKRKKEDPNYKLNHSLSLSVYQALKGIRKSQHTLELLGCSVEYLKMHLEALFQPGMTWDNWSQFGWHIDHRLPISSFDLIDPKQQRLCFHYTNLQPLWWLDNIRKSNKIECKNPLS